MDSKNGNIPTKGSWIKKELPSEILSRALYKDGFKDILEERRGEMDFMFAMKSRDNIPVYKYNKPRDYDALKNDVLNSDRVKFTIEKLSLGDKMKEQSLRKEAEEIYSGMAHLLNVKGIRVMAFLVIKVFKSLFRRVYVNEEGVHRLHQLMQEYPVVLMPSHRSYMDFLLLSYVCYHYDLPIPAIAAAMDFKGMKLMGWLLQNCGAFYIRRTFGSDHLYWAIFTEYVQTQLRNGDQPLEFFVEGTRSRTNKSYTPKTGMLAASLESYFKAELPDTMIIPISITYDRILEESLYAYELIGIPKPKESTSGLLKARTILDEDFGSVHIHVGDCISIRQFSLNRIDRVVHSLEPRYINNLLPDEKSLINDLAFFIVKNQQNRFVIPPGTLLAAIMMQHRGGVSIDELSKQMDWLKMQACNMGAYVDWPGNMLLKEVVVMCIQFHKNLFTLNNDGTVLLKLTPKPSVAKNKSPSKSPSKPPSKPPSSSSSSPLLMKEQLLSDAVMNIMLASYRNHVLHLFVNVAMVMLSVRSKLGRVSEVTADDIFPLYLFLEKLLSKDFVFQPNQTEQSYKQAVLQLKNSGILFQAKSFGVNPLSSGLSGGDWFLVDRSINEQSIFLCRMFEPFLVAYWVTCHYLSSRSADRFGRPLAKKQKDLLLEVQTLSLNLIDTGATCHLEILSLDMINNAISSLIDLKALSKDKRGDDIWLSPNQAILLELGSKIGEFVEVPLINNIAPITSLQSRL